MEHATLIVKGGHLDGTHEVELDDEGGPADGTNEAGRMFAEFARPNAPQSVMFVSNSTIGVAQQLRSSIGAAMNRGGRQMHEYKFVSMQTEPDGRRIMQAEYVGIIDPNPTS